MFNSNSNSNNSSSTKPQIDLEVTDRKFAITFDKIDEKTNFPSFSKPQIVGAFSLNSERSYVEGLDGLKYLHLPESNRVHYDLDLFTKKQLLNPNHKEESQEHEELMHKQTNELVQLLEWINRHKETFLKRKPHFVFYRGLLTKILGTPYENRDSWKIGAMLKNGTIYLRNIDTEESIENRRQQSNNPRQSRMASWGYNFESFLLSDEPTSSPNHNIVAKNECNFVFQSQLVGHNLLYAAEIDGVWLPQGSDINLKAHPDKLKDFRLVELKTTRAFPPDGMSFNFRRFNLRKWWSQCFPVGISHVVAGLRDDEGIVHELKLFTVKDLSKEGKEWSSTVCFNFLNQFLSQVKSIIKADESSVYTFEFKPQRGNTIHVEVSVERDSGYRLRDIL